MKTTRSWSWDLEYLSEQHQPSLLPTLHPHTYSSGTWLFLCPRQLAQFPLEWSLFWPTLSLGIRTPSPTICPHARRTVQHLQQAPEVGLGYWPNLWQVAKGQSSVIHGLKDHMEQTATHLFVSFAKREEKTDREKGGGEGRDTGWRKNCRVRNVKGQRKGKRLEVKEDRRVERRREEGRGLWTGMDEEDACKAREGTTPEKGWPLPEKLNSLLTK